MVGCESHSLKSCPDGWLSANNSACFEQQQVAGSFKELLGLIEADLGLSK